MANQIIITKEIVDDVFERRTNGQTVAQIARHYPFSTWTVGEILKRKKGQQFLLKPEHASAIQKNGTPRRTFTKPTHNEKRNIIDGVVALVEAKRDFQRAIINALNAGLTKAEVNRVIHPLTEQER